MKNNYEINTTFLSYNNNPDNLYLIKEYLKDFNEGDWYHLSENPVIFELDYETMKHNNQNLYEELIKEVMKPSRVFKNPDYDYIEELFGD